MIWEYLGFMQLVFFHACAAFPGLQIGQEPKTALGLCLANDVLGTRVDLRENLENSQGFLSFHV